MPDPKRHHYLPQFYLEGFADRGTLCIYDRVERAYREQTPRNTAVISHYYSYEGEEGELQTEFETALARVEGEAKPVVEKLAIDRKPISARERQVLSLFIALLRMRVPDFEKEVGELMDTIVKKVNRIVFATEETTQATLKWIEEETGEEVDASPEDLLRFAAEEKYELTNPRARSLGLMFSLADDLARIIYELDWIVAFAGPGADFLTTDNPFTIVPPPKHLRIPHRGVGIVTPGAEKYVPLTRSSLLGMLAPGGRLGFLEFSPEQVEIANMNNATNCDRFVIGPNKDTVRRAVTATGVDKTSRRRKWTTA